MATLPMTRPLRNTSVAQDAETTRMVKLTLAYDGTNYSGWQIQPERKTVQETLETALRKITGESIRTIASGRTDAGVHALGQVVGVQTKSRLTADVLTKALNAELPNDIVVVQTIDVAADFHPIRDARRKRYRYLIHNRSQRDVFAFRYCWHFPVPLDIDAMHRAGSALVGRHDFSSYQSSGAPRESTVRTVFDLNVRNGQGAQQQKIVFEVEADGFLYNMVRAIIGTLVEVGRGAMAPQWPAEVLAACDRRAGGPTAPPQGLFLVSVDYGD